MFTLASYLGATVDTGVSPVAGSMLATLCVFLPGFLILVEALPLWTSLARHPRINAAMAGGVGAPVVGLLLSVLYQPLWTSGVEGERDIVTVVVGFGFSLFMRRPIFAVLPWCVAMTFVWQAV